MYSTCIGLILKGYNDYENKNKQFEEKFRRIEVPASLQRQPVDEKLDAAEQEQEVMMEEHNMPKVKERKSLKTFMDSFKNGLIDLFKEEGDAHL
jgi:cell division protein FtsA